jgi:hypothetical protein
MTTSVANVTDTAQWALATLRHEFRVEYVRAVSLLCGAAWLFGVFGGMAFERWRDAEVAVVPQAIAVPAQMAAPSSSSAEVTPKKPTPAPARDRHRERIKPKRHGEDAEPPHGTVMQQGSNSDGTATGAGEAKYSGS